MSNPSMRLGPVTLPAAAEVASARLVALGADGVSHAGADGPVFGAVAGAAAPAADRDDNDLTLGLPAIVAVHTAPASLPLETADVFVLGAAVYAAADGKVSATGTVQVGVAVAASAAGRVRTRLTVPSGSGA